MPVIVVFILGTYILTKINVYKRTRNGVVKFRLNASMLRSLMFIIVPENHLQFIETRNILLLPDKLFLLCFLCIKYQQPVLVINLRLISFNSPSNE